MKNYPGLFLVFLFICIVKYAGAQSTEYSFQVVSGFFHFGGKSAVESTDMVNSFNPYGNKSDLSFGSSFQMQLIEQNRVICGFQIGYQFFTSRVNTVYTQSTGHNNFPSSTFKEFGEANLSYRYLNLFPYLGRRYTYKKFDFDFVGGIEFGITLSKGELTFSNSDRLPNRNPDHPIAFKNPSNVGTPDFNLDVRPAINLTVYYTRFGISIGYFYGVSNYISNNEPELSYVDDNSKVYSRMLRLGINYRIKMNPKSER